MKGRVAALTALLLGLLLVFGVTVNRGLNRVGELNDIRAHAQRLESQTLTLRRHEKDFLERKRRVYLERFEAADAQANATLALLKQAQGTSPVLEEASHALRQYSAVFHSFVHEHERLGLDEDSGFVGQLRASGTVIRSMLEQRNEESLLVHQNRLQAAERDFLLAPSEARVAALMAALDRAKKIDPSLAPLFREYEAAFLRVAHQRKLIGFDETKGLHGRMRQAVHRAEHEILKAIQSSTGKARSELTQLSRRLTAWLVVTLSSTVLLCFLLFLNFSRLEKLREEVAAREQELQVTLSSIGDGVLATDRSGTIRFVNGVAAGLTGVSPEAAEGRPIDEVFQIFSGATGERVPTPVKEVLETGKIVGLANHTTLKRADGTEFHIADSAAPIFDKNGEIHGVVLVFRDVTEQYKLEEQLRQSGKLESLGLLAGGVAHDFNNLLTAILSAAEVLKLDEKLDSMSQESVDTILLSSSQAADLTRKLLSFSRKGKLISSPVEVHPLIERVVDILRSSLPKNIKTQIHLAAEESEVVGDPSQLEAMVMNLGINGADAMPRGGSLSIRTRVRTIDSSFCESSTFDLEPGAFLEISVEDEGEGIESHIQSHIFEPFFTTKPEGKGTGLGLASTYGAVKDHGGEIRVYSEKGYGTVFRILLPLHREHMNKKVEASEVSIPRGAGRILVVDDEQYVRKTTRLILESLGYEVVLAESAESALAHLEGEQTNFDLALVDMVMPGMSGEELFYRLRQKWSRLPLVLMSGFTKEANVNAMYAAGLMAFIRKPFTRAELGAAIAESLKSSRVG